MGKKQSEAVVFFLEDIEAVCREHNMSISHEDGHGAFIIEKLDEYNIKWLKKAYDETEKKGE